MKSFLRFASLLLLQFCFIYPVLLAQTPDSWTQKANFGGLGRLNAVGFNIGNKGYIGTGANATTAFSDIWEYDPSTDTWAQKADYGGGARRGAYAFVVGNKAYVGGGSNSAADENPATSSLWEYNSFANTWTQKASSGPLFYGSVAFSIDGKGYVITGGIASYSADNMNFALTRRSSGNVAMYDPETDTWTNKARGPFDLAGAFGFTINGKGYVGGGTDNAGGIKKGFYEYNPATDSWTAKADFAGDRAFGSPSFVLGNKGFVGLTGLVGAAQNLYEYNPASDTWTSRAVYPDGATVGGAAFSIGNKGYIGTGSSKNTFYEYTSAETFTPATALKFDPSETAGDNSRLNYVSVDNPFRGFQKEITVEFWMYAPSANMPFGSIMGQGSNNVDANWVWLMHPETNGTMTFYVSDGASFKTAKCNIIAGSWHHYAATSSAGSTKFYVDGNEVSFYTINGQQFNDAVGGGLSSGLLSNNNAVLHIGKDVRYATRNIGNNDPKNRYAVMTIDEVRIWNRALCADEIRHNKNVEINPAVQTGLQHYYSFNQGLVNANNPGETILRDLSGNNRNGELKNFSLYGTNSNWVASGFTSTGIYTLYDNSAAPITGSNNVCIGNSTTLSNAKSGGKWLSSNPGVATINEVTGQVNAISAGVTTITYTTSCGAVSSMNLSVNPIPTTSITGTNTICSGSTTTLTASGGTGTTYLWNTGATTASINVSPTVTTTYTVTATNAGGCTAQASSTVTVNAVPTVSISGINTICSGSTTTLTASGAIGTTYLWSTGATTASINVSPTATTTYTVTATNAVGCTNQASSTVTVNAAPTAAISGTNTICSGGSTTLIATGGGGGTTYAWNTGATTFAIPVSPTVTTTYSVTLTNTAGCTSQASRTVTVNPTPSVTASSNSPVVLGNTLQLSANGTTNYSWSGPNGFTSSLQNPVINNVTAAANGTYTVTGTDAGPGCTNTASVNVTVLSTPATALKTDGVDDHVTISNPFRAFNKEITVEFWMNTPTGKLAQGSIMGQSSLNVDGMGTDVWLMHPDLGGTNLDFYVNDAGTWRRATVPIIAGGWHHYVGVASEFGIKFYVDGVLKKTETGVSTGILNNPNSIMQIGKDPRHTNFRFADMTIDEVRIWSRALCLEEINNNKNCELNPTGQNGLQQYYRFNQGIVGANNSTETSLTDLSGNNRHGVLSGFALTGANSNWVASGSTNTGTCTSFSTPTAPITGTTTICGIGNTSTLSNAIAGGLWSSSNTNIATIHANTGLVTALSEGTTTITYKNECGGISTVTVRVVSTIPPTITGPAGGTNVCPGNTVTLTAPVALANYQWFRDGVAVTSTTSTRTYNATVSGTYTATRISSGCTSALSNAITVTIADAVKPSITCPPNQTIDLDANCKATLPDYRSLLTVSDNCTPTGSLVITQSPAAGSEVNNKGSMIVTFTVRDAAGNESTCTITIEKKDVTGPIVTCPAPIVVNATTNTCGAVVTFTSPNATDNCGIIPFTSFRGGEPNQFQGALQDYLQLYTDGTWDDLQNTTLNKWIVEFNTIITTSFPGYTRIGEFGGHTYYVSTSTATWINARVSAQSIGGDLVSINTQAENSFVAPSGIAWVGGYQDLSDSKYIEPGNASQNYGGWKWVDGTSMSTPKITITQTAGLPSGSVFPVGVTTNTFIARDESGNESTCSFTVTVRDVQPPVISCPANINVTATSAAGAVVNYTTPVGTDNCSGATTERIAGLASGSTFPIRTTTVTHRVTDAAGLSTECSFTVTVSGLAPVIVSPGNQTVDVAPGTCSAVVNFAATETTGIPASTITYSIPSGSTFGVGSTVVTATATNAVGTSSVQFTITVRDAQPPVITCPADITVTATSAAGAVVNYVAPVGTDNCPGTTTTRIAGLASGSVFPQGTTTVTYRATDAAGNITNCSFNVTVNAPTVAASALNLDGVNDFVAVNNPFRAFQKEITVEFWMNTPNTIMPYGSILGQSTSGVDNMSTNVWLMHPDTKGNIDFLVNDGGVWKGVTVALQTGWHHYVGVASEFGVRFYVDGVLAPTISGGPGLATGISNGIVNNPNSVLHIGKDVRHNTGRFGNITIDEVRIWSRVLCQEEIQNNMNCELNPQSQTGLEEYYRFNQGFVDYDNATETTLLDLSGKGRNGQLNNLALTGNSSNWIISGSTNNGTCSPYIPPTAPITGTTSVCIGASSTLSNTIGGGLWSSSNTSVATINANTGVLVSVSPGTTVITYRTECGSVITTDFTVKALPVISISATGNTSACPGNTVTLEATPIDNATYQWKRNGVDISGVNDRVYLASTTGSYSATVTVDGCSSAISNAIGVTIADTEKPVIANCPPNQIINLDASCKAILPDYRSLLTASDNCTPANELVITQSPAAGSEVNDKGDLIVTFTVTDAYGNNSTCTITVTKKDVTAPVISCPANINVTATSAAGAVVNYTTPVGTDNCGGATTERTAGLASGSTFPIGTTTVTYRVTDAAGLFTECSFTVTVVGVAPVISCPANITVNAAAGTCAANVNFAATETVGIPASTITYTINGNPVVSGASFPVGTTTVVATATNAVGSSSCSFTVTVVDNQNPTITAPADVQGNNTAGLCTGTVTLGTPVTSDNCGVASVTNDAPITGIFPVGTTTVIWTVTDIHGNKSTATQTVVIVDNEKPTISVTNVNVNNDAGKCGASVTIAQPITADNCDIASVVGVRSDNASLSAEYPVGTTTITWKVTDIHGNDATTTQTVVVNDTELPVVKTNNIVVQLGANGQASITTSQINNGSTDNCAIASIVLDKMNFNCSNVGENTVLLTVTDIHGNSASANAIVTVQDNILPTVITQPVTVTLVNGAASVTAAQVNNGSFDNCGIATMTVSPANFNCNNIGSNTVILTVTDVNGNTNTRSAIVTVVGQLPSCSITSAPTSNVFTGGNPNNLYLGYGAQSTVLNVAATGGSSYTYQWSGTATQMLSSTTAAAPVFTPTAPGNYTFTVTVTNNFGCTSTCSITICVKDIRVPGTGLKGSPAKVYICHVPPGNPNNPQTLEISVNAVATHIGKHDGDRLGTCAMTPCAEPAPTTVANALISKAVVEGESKASTNEDLKVTVMPNPSATYFTLKLESKYDAPVNMRVVDVLGRVVDNRMKLGSNATVEVGHNYQSGTYFAEFIQGNRRKVVQLLKIKR